MEGQDGARRAARWRRGVGLVGVFLVALAGSLAALLAPDAVHAAPGVPIPGFGRSGVVSVGSSVQHHGAGVNTNPQAVVARPDGTLIVASFRARETDSTIDQRTTLTAYGPDGGPVASWNGGQPVPVGDTVVDQEGAPLLLDLAALPDGSIVTLAATGSGPTTGAEIERYSADGTRVPDWGGLVAVPPNGAVANFDPSAAQGSLAGALACRPDSSCYVGTSVIGSGRTTVARVGADGHLDHAFTAPTLRIDADVPPVFPGDPQWLSATPDGGVLVSGAAPTVRHDAPERAIALTGAGALNAAFGTGGSIAIAPGSTPATDQIASSLTVDTAGRVVVASQAVSRAPGSGRTLRDLVTQRTADTVHGRLARFTAAGVPDPTFGPAGQGSVDLPPQAPIAARDFTPAPVQVRTGGNGSITVVWSVGPGPSVQTLRYVVAGLPDPSWGDAGIAHTGAALPHPAATASAALRPDGSVAVLTTTEGLAGGYLTVLGTDPFTVAVTPTVAVGLNGHDARTCGGVAGCAIQLAHAATLTGTVTAGNAPVSGARVSLALYTLHAGSWTPVSAPTTVTDAHGHWSIAASGAPGRLGQWRATVLVGSTTATTDATSATPTRWVWGPAYAALRRSPVESAVTDGALLDIAGILHTVCAELGSTGPSTCGLPLGVPTVPAARAGTNVWSVQRATLTAPEQHSLDTALAQALRQALDADERTATQTEYRALLRSPLTRYAYRYRRNGLALDITLDVLGSIPLQPTCTGTPASAAHLLCTTLVTSPTAFNAVVAATT